MTVAPRAAPQRHAARSCSVAAAVGAIAFALGLAFRRANVALAVLDASWLFFAGVATGSVAVGAIVRVAGGRWAGPVLPIAEAGERFFGPALGVLLVLIGGAHTLAPWVAPSAGSLAALALRQVVPTTLLFVLGRRFVRRARLAQEHDRQVFAAAVAYLLTYAVALSLWAYDWVLVLSRTPQATVVPAYYCFGALVSGLAWTAFVAAARGLSDPDLRHDIGKLLFAFVAVWAYLLWALFLATWYANVPEEVEPLLRRVHPVYAPVTAGVLVLAFACPFALLFFEPLKRNRVIHALAAGMVVGGLWAERVVLVLPSLDLMGGGRSLAVGCGTALGMAGLFLRAVWPHIASLGAAAASPRAVATNEAAVMRVAKDSL